MNPITFDDEYVLIKIYQDKFKVYTHTHIIGNIYIVQRERDRESEKQRDRDRTK